jgi:hypothetical protein
MASYAASLLVTNRVVLLKTSGIVVSDSLNNKAAAVPANLRRPTCRLGRQVSLLDVAYLNLNLNSNVPP